MMEVADLHAKGTDKGTVEYVGARSSCTALCKAKTCCQISDSSQPAQGMERMDCNAGRETKAACPIEGSCRVICQPQSARCDEQLARDGR